MNWVQSIIDFLTKFWPLDTVDQWEEGIYYVCGRAMKRRLRPGLYAIIPWFTRIEKVPVVPTPISTPLLNITLRDGSTLSYSATAVIRVANPWLAVNTVDDYKESVSELITATLSDRLADVDASRIDPEKRRRLVADLLKWCGAETEIYGVEVKSLRFTNFGINQRAYRILTDSAISGLMI